MTDLRTKNMPDSGVSGEEVSHQIRFDSGVSKEEMNRPNVIASDQLIINSSSPQIGISHEGVPEDISEAELTPVSHEQNLVKVELTPVNHEHHNCEASGPGINPAPSGPTQDKVELTPANHEQGCVEVSRHAKFGDNSIAGEGSAKPLRACLGAGVRSNVITWMHTHLKQQPQFIAINAAVTQWEFNCPLVCNDAWGARREENVQDQLPLFAPNGDPNIPVTSAYSRTTGVLKMELINDFMKDMTNVDTRAVASSLTSKLQQPQSTCLGIAAHLLVNREISDTTALYTKGWCLVFLRAIIARRLGVNAAYPVVWNAVDANYNERDWSNINVGGALAEDISERRLVCLSRDFSPEQIACLRHLARAGQPMPPDQVEERPRINQVDWPGIPIAVYYPAAPGAAVIADFVADEMRSTLVQLAVTRGEHRPLIKGYTKASTWLLQRRVAQGVAPIAIRYFTSTLERACTTAMHAPRDFNPLWRWLGVAAPAESQSSEPVRLSRDFEVLSSQSVSELLMVGAGVAQATSLGVSLSLHTNNLGGREINIAAGMVAAQGGTVKSYCQQLFQKRGEQKTLNLYRLAAAELANVSDIVIDPEALDQDYWCNNFDGIGPRAAGTQWQGVWEHRVPYLITPFAFSWMLRLWPDQWALFEHGVTLNVMGDTIKDGPQAGWYADMGDGSYRKISGPGCENESPYLFTSYGARVLNALSQHYERVAGYGITYRPWGRSHSTMITPNALLAGPALGVADYNVNLNLYVPGFIKSYNWLADNTLAPALVVAAFGAGEWSPVRKDMIKNTDNIGLLLPEVTAISQGSISNFNLGMAFMGIDDGNDEPQNRQQGGQDGQPQGNE
nr:MAG: capsid protein [brine shrimp toti-like virus 1]